ncbi:MAG: 2-dehydropantoate 2-reductase [Minicystis sp.]
MKTHIAVVGPGAIGGTLAAWLDQVPGHEVTVCARTPFERLVVDVPGGRTLESTPEVLTDPARAREVDWVVTVTKTYDTEGAASWLARLVGPGTRVVVVQNGVEHMERFPGLVPSERTLPAIIDIPAARSAPGRIQQGRHGDFTVPEGDLGRAFAALFAGLPLAPRTTADFLSASWRKLALNSAAVVNCLARRPAILARSAKAAAVMRAVTAEAVAVGRAMGAQLPDGLPDEVIARYLDAPPGQTSSVLADWLAGRPLEIDARNGVIVRMGEKLGVPTPLNAMAVAVMEAAMEVGAAP